MLLLISITYPYTLPGRSIGIPSNKWQRQQVLLNLDRKAIVEYPVVEI